MDFQQRVLSCLLFQWVLSQTTRGYLIIIILATIDKIGSSLDDSRGGSTTRERVVSGWWGEGVTPRYIGPCMPMYQHIAYTSYRYMYAGWRIPEILQLFRKTRLFDLFVYRSDICYLSHRLHFIFRLNTEILCYVINCSFSDNFCDIDSIWCLKHRISCDSDRFYVLFHYLRQKI